MVRTEYVEHINTFQRLQILKRSRFLYCIINLTIIDPGTLNYTGPIVFRAFVRKDLVVACCMCQSVSVCLVHIFFVLSMSF